MLPLAQSRSETIISIIIRPGNFQGRRELFSCGHRPCMGPKFVPAPPFFPHPQSHSCGRSPGSHHPRHRLCSRAHSHRVRCRRGSPSQTSSTKNGSRAEHMRRGTWQWHRSFLPSQRFPGLPEIHLATSGGDASISDNACRHVPLLRCF